MLTGDQLPTQTFTAFYYVGMDVVMISQFAYFAHRKRAPRAAAAAADGIGAQVRRWLLHARCVARR